MELAATIAATMAVSGTAGAAGTASTVSTILAGTSSVFGALSAISANNMANLEARAQAFQAEDAARSEEVDGIRRRTAMKADLARIIGENDVNFAAAGIDISSGIAAGNRQEQGRRATSEITIDRADADRQRAALRARAAGLRASGRASRTAGFLRAGGELASFGAGVAQRG